VVNSEVGQKRRSLNKDSYLIRQDGYREETRSAFVANLGVLVLYWFSVGLRYFRIRNIVISKVSRESHSSQGLKTENPGILDPI